MAVPCLFEHRTRKTVGRGELEPSGASYFLTALQRITLPNKLFAWHQQSDRKMCNIGKSSLESGLSLLTVIEKQLQTTTATGNDMNGHHNQRWLTAICKQRIKSNKFQRKNIKFRI
jgi:hypothetical protein